MAITAGLALTGCTAAEVEPAPQTAPAVPTDSKSAAGTAGREGLWTVDDVKVSGATAELEAQAQQALDSHVAYYAGISGGKYGQHLYALNAGGIDRWLNITEVKSDMHGAVEFVLDSYYTSPALRSVATREVCSLLRFGTADKEAVSGLQSLTLTATDTGESFTVSDDVQC
ncbi:hypothetical protein [Glutamicibacter sp. X7]